MEQDLCDIRLSALVQNKYVKGLQRAFQRILYKKRCREYDVSYSRQRFLASQKGVEPPTFRLGVPPEGSH